MSTRFFILCVVLGLCLTPATQAANIILVSDQYDDNGRGGPDDAGWADFLRAQGYTVDYRAVGTGNGYWRTLNAARISELNAADIIIVARCTDSASYANDATEVGQWNGVTKPLIMLTPYISRNSRWIWYNNATLSEDSGTPTLVAMDPHHPIFKGVNLDAQNQVDIYDQTVGSATVSMVGVLDNGNGTLLAKAISGTRTIIAEWQPGKPFYAGGPQTPAGKRMIFCAGTREGGGQGRGEFNLNPEGQKLLSNAIEYMIGNLVREPWVKAWQPDPADGAVNVAVPLFRWTAGETAMFHNVYFGTAHELTEANLVASRQLIAMYFALNLTPGTKYYWRVDEVELSGNVNTGDVWSFTTASLVAYDPRPRDGAKWLDPATVTLQWQPGQNAIKHDVYFGTDKAAVEQGDASAFKGNQLAMSFDPGTLTADTTYCWRVDEVLLDGTKRTGNVWSFTTLGPGGGIRGFYFANASLTGTPAINRIDPQINFNWADASPTGLPADGFSIRWVGELDVPFTETYTFYPTTDDGVRLWVNDVLLLDLWANRRSATEAKASIDLVGGQRYPIVMEFYNAEGTAVAELRWESPSIEKALIPRPAFSPPLRASSPNPGSGAVDVPQSLELAWNAGEKATGHEVYFGDSADAVANATTAGPDVYQGRKAADVTGFDPGSLEWNKTYYWRIDEVNDASPESPWKGTVWSFTTADSIVVDDFEGYTDDEGNRIYETWIDGWTNGTGSQVGYVQAPFAERTIVHGGQQSMPLDYNNAKSPFYSEAEREFAPLQNWTVNGVTDLSLWFRGNPVRFADKGNGAFTISGSGHDIWDNADDFRFAYKRLSGNASVVVKVESIVNTNAWAKAGVMIRESLDAGSTFAYMIVSYSNGVSFGWRQTPGGACGSMTQAGITAPQWVKLTRTGNAFTAQYSADGKAWTDIKNADGTVTSTTVNMAGSIYIGLCVTSHNTAATTTAEFTGAATTGGVTGQWTVTEIGDDPQPANSPDKLYVAVEDSAGKVAVATNPDASAVTPATWTQWKVPLSSLTGVNLTRVKKLYLGVGDRRNPVVDGAGLLYIDDIRVMKAGN